LIGGHTVDDKEPKFGLAVTGYIVHYMTMLNDRASRLMLEMGASACTDVTGFGLLGHLYKMCRASGILCDPVTSGGLLFSIDKDREDELFEKARSMNMDVWIIGETTECFELEVL